MLTLDEVIPGSYKIRHLPIILMTFTGRQTNFEWMDISERSENGLVNQAGQWRFLFYNFIGAFSIELYQLDG